MKESITLCNLLTNIENSFFSGELYHSQNIFSNVNLELYNNIKNKKNHCLSFINKYLEEKGYKFNIIKVIIPRDYLFYLEDKDKKDITIILERKNKYLQFKNINNENIDLKSLIDYTKESDNNYESIIQDENNIKLHYNDLLHDKLEIINSVLITKSTSITFDSNKMKSLFPLVNLTSDVQDYPYPILIQDNFINEDIYKEMLQSFPPPDKFGKSIRMHGDLTIGDIEYDKLIKNNNAWNKFHNYIYSQDFFFDLVCYFRKQLCKQNDCLLNFDDMEYELFYEGRKIKKDYGNKHANKIHSRMDIGYGKDGYGKKFGGGGIHIDNKSRLFSILIYFCDTNDFDNGEFLIHDSSNNFEVAHKIAPVHNRAIISIQNNNAFHSVSPVSNTKKPRNALYLSLFSKMNIWKPINNKLLANKSLNRK